MKHPRHNQHSNDARDMVRATMREAGRGGFRVGKSKDQKSVEAGWRAIDKSSDVIERDSRARAVRNIADFATKNYERSHPIRSAMHGVWPDKRLQALRDVRDKAAKEVERAQPAARQIERETIGGGAKYQTRIAGELAGKDLERQAKGLATQWRKRENVAGALGRAEAESEARRMEEVGQTLTHARRHGDVVDRTDAALRAREVIERSQERIGRAGAGDGQHQAPAMVDDAQMGRAGRGEQGREDSRQLMEQADALARSWEQRETTHDDRDAGQHYTALRTDRVAVREALAHGDEAAIRTASQRLAERMSASGKGLEAREAGEAVRGQERSEPSQQTQERSQQQMEQADALVKKWEQREDVMGDRAAWQHYTGLRTEREVLREALAHGDEASIHAAQERLADRLDEAQAGLDRRADEMERARQGDIAQERAQERARAEEIQVWRGDSARDLTRELREDQRQNGGQGRDTDGGREQRDRQEPEQPAKSRDGQGRNAAIAAQAEQVRGRSDDMLEQADALARSWEQREDGRGERGQGQQAAALQRDSHALREALASGDDKAVCRAGHTLSTRMHEASREQSRGSAAAQPPMERGQGRGPQLER